MKNFAYLSTFLPGLFAVTGAGCIYLSTLEENIFSRRKILACLVVLFFLFCLANASVLYTRKHRNTHGLVFKRIAILALLSIPLSLLTPGSLSYLQTRSAVIEPISGTGQVVFEGLNNGHIDIPHSQFQIQGSWQYVDQKFSTQSQGQIRWNGRTSNQPSLTFATGPGMGKVRISWDQDVEVYSLESKDNGQAVFRTILPISFAAQAIYIVSGFIFFILLFYFLLSFVLSLPSPALERKRRRWFWLKYAVPIAIPSLLMLFVYSPAIMSGDSLVQWTQAHTLQLTDQHPAFHTLSIWLITRLWDSPTMVAIFQILFLSIVIAWGISALIKRGMPDAIAWLISILFAISPVTCLYSATIWKDIPYSVSLLWLTMIMVEIYFSNGGWLANCKNLAALSVCLLCVSLFRHNGLPVALIIPLILIPVFWQQKKWSIAVLVAVIGVRWMITGPVYDFLNVQPMPANLKYSTVLYHIGSHINNGTNLSDQERQEIERLMPLDAWDYSPCTADSIIWNSSLNTRPIQENPLEYAGLVLRLFLQDPLPDLRATLNLGSLVYNIAPSCRTYITPLMYKPDGSPGATWIDYQVEGVGAESSRLSALVEPRAKFYNQTFSFNSLKLFNVLFWRSAVYIIVIVLVLIPIVLMEKKWKALLILSPALIQSIVLMAINVSQEARYQYGVYLISEYFIGLLAFILWKYSNQRSISTGDE